MSMEMIKMDVLRCDGQTAESVHHKPGDFLGHLAPCLALGLWGLHLFAGACWRAVLADRDPSAPPFSSRTWEPFLPFLPGRLWRKINQRVPLDTLYKAFCTTVVFHWPYQQIICTDGVRYGRVVGQHVMRWAHTTLVLSFATLGFVELAALRVRFPHGTPTAALVVAHIVCCIIFSYHQKHEVLDQQVHGLIGWCYLVGAGCGMAEILRPDSFLATAAKLYFHMLAAFWLGVVGYIIYGNSVFWSPTYDGRTDVGPAMFAPILFAMLMLGLVFCMLAIYAVMDAMAERQLRGGAPRGLPAATAVVALTQLPGRRGAAAEEAQGLLAAGDGGAGGSGGGGGGGRLTPGKPVGGGGGGFEEYGAERTGGMRGRV